MTTTTTPTDLTAAEASLSQGRLPRWSTPATVAAVVVLGALAALVLDAPVPLVVGLGVLALLVALPALAWVVEGRRRANDRMWTVLVTIAFALALLPLLSLMITVTQNGLARFDWEFLTTDMRGVLGEGGGALHAIVGTLIITGLATIISVPVGIMTAVYLVEYGRGRLARAITLLVDVMTGIPSIVAGLFAFALFSIFFGPSIRFGIGGAVALSVLMIPVVVRSVEEMLKLVPNELREASYALGVSQWRTIVRVVLPTAAAGIATGVTLAIARVIGETAPLLIITGSTNILNTDPVDGRMSSLPIFTYYSYTIPGVPPEFGVERAWAAALTLFLIVMLLNLVARLLSRLFGSPTSR